jgi:colanic acid biosynthesis glycosyl transferase WcaI
VRVLILNQFFYPDLSATSQLMTDLAEDLARAGVEVSAVAGRERYAGGESLSVFETWQGITIYRVRGTKFDRGNHAKRAFSYLFFFVAALLKLLRVPKQDTIVVLTTPPLISLVACLVKTFRGSRVVCLVQDLYPEVAIELGVMSDNGVLSRLLKRFSRWSMHYADTVIALGECMRRRIEATGVPPSKIHVLRNWADGSQSHPVPRNENRFLLEHALQDKFVVLYSGNLGKAHDVRTILEAALQLQNEHEVAFVFIGEGPKMAEVREFIARHRLSNIRLLPYLERAKLSESLSAGDVGLISLAAGLGGLVVPSKLYGIMAAGRPAILVGAADTEVGLTLETGKCGYVVGNGDAAGLCDRILFLVHHRSLVEQMGRRARKVFEERFDRPIITRIYYKLLCGQRLENHKASLDRDHIVTEHQNAEKRRG